MNHRLFVPIVLYLFLSSPMLQAQVQPIFQNTYFEQPILKALQQTSCSYYNAAIQTTSILPQTEAYEDECTFVETSHVQFERYVGCQSDAYTVQINGVTYDESNPHGKEVLVDSWNCDSIVEVALTFHPNSIREELYVGCIGDGHAVIVNGIIYNEKNPVGEERMKNQYGCDSVVVVDLLYREAPEVHIEGDFKLCEGEALTMSASAKGAAAWSWYSPSGHLLSSKEVLTLETDIEAGQYELEVTGVNTCTQTEFIPVQVTTAAAIKDQSAIPATICLGDTLHLGSFAESIKIDWDFGDGSSSRQINPSYFYKKEGLYPIKATINDPTCGLITIEQEIAVIDCQSTTNQKSDIVYYDVAPDPNEGNIQVEVELESPNGILICLKDQEGTTQHREILDGKAFYLSAIENVPTGAYFLEIWSPASASFVVQQVVVE